MVITNCRVNHLENPVGFRMERTVFSWKVREAKGKRQRTARLVVAKDPMFHEIVWDSGECADLNSVACDAHFPLECRTRYFWQVYIASDVGETAQSSVQFFETAKRNEPWTARWISCSNDEERHPIFFKMLRLDGVVRRARLYICGLGLYEAYLDGKKIGQEYLAPYCNDYSRWLQYQTYDVTEQIQDGAELSVLLGNGWYKGRFSFSSQDTAGKYGDSFQLIAEVHLDYEDGSHQVIGTDESWQVRRSNITFSGIYDGEHRDDTLLIFPPESCLPGTEDTAKLTERMSVPVTVYREWQPVELIHTPAGEQVLDLGQNFAGIFRLRVHEPAGTKVHLQFGEILQNGNFYRDNLRSALAEYVYISNGGEVILEPHFTFFGYRYVKVTGVPDLKAEDFTALALSSTLTSIGSIHTGHPLVNQLISNTWWGLRSNAVDVPTDCPQRDERLGWTGDAQVFAETACCLEDMYAFYAKYLHDMAHEQRKTGGKVPEYIPSRGNQNTSSVWGDAACIIPWTLYRFYGDESILRDQYQSMKAWVEYIRRTDGEDRSWGRTFHYGDWLALDHETGDPSENSGATDVGYIAYLYYMNSARIVAQAAGILGKAEDSEQYSALADSLADYIRHEYFTGSGRCSVATQTALLLALRHRLTDDTAWTQSRLRELFFHKKDKLLAGFVGTPLALPTLSENGMGELAYKLLLNEDYPGWLYAVKLGATTIWERWNSVLPDGSISDTGMNSLNHYAYGAVTQWLFQYAGGIRQHENSIGWRRVLLAPELNWTVREADTVIDSPLGEYRCAWRILDARHVELHLTVPFGGLAELTIPEAVSGIYANTENPVFAHVENDTCILEPGCYHLIYETARSLKPEYSCDTPMAQLMEQTEIKAALLNRLPQLALLKASIQKRPLGELLLLVAGNAGLPDRETTARELIPELNAIIAER